MCTHVSRFVSVLQATLCKLRLQQQQAVGLICINDSTAARSEVQGLINHRQKEDEEPGYEECYEQTYPTRSWCGNQLVSYTVLLRCLCVAAGSGTNCSSLD